jgi:hypothetical protein
MDAGRGSLPASTFPTMKANLLTKFLFAGAFLWAVAVPSLSVAADAGKPQYFELRVYTTKSEAQQQRIDAFWHDAAVPAYRRLGAGPVGVFTEEEASATNHVYVLIAHDSLESMAAVPAKLAADAEYQKAGAGYLGAPKSDPAYVRIQSSVSVAFDAMNHLEVPVAPSADHPRVFELRTYWSHSEAKAINKVAMFNDGEIPLMKKVNLGPVFFGQTIVGEDMPNLVYMVSSGDREAHKVAWKGFFDDAVWTRLKNDPQYKDNVSRVISVFLKRLPASQI